MDASAAVVLGALVGGTFGLGGGALTLLGQARHLRSQHRAEREQWVLELRRSAYSRLMQATKQLSNALWKASDRLHESQAGPSDWQEAYVAVHDAWTEFSAASAAVSVAGPAAAAASASQLRSAMYEWEMICTDWTHRAVASGKAAVGDCEDRFHRAARAKQPLDEAFQHCARRALGTDV